MTRWMRTTEAAQRLRLSPKYVRKLIATGAIPGAVKAGPARNSPYVVPEQAVDDYARQHTS
jgi:excisionase family DNA binding protein